MIPDSSSGFFSSLDRHFSRLMEEFSGAPNAPLRAAALASRAVQEGHVCVNLADFAGKPLPFDDGKAPPEPMPTLSEWLSVLAASPVVAAHGEERPLVLRGSRLYLFRYWDYENRLVSQLRLRSAGIVSDFDSGRARLTLAQLFKENPDNGVDQQKTAAAVALLKKFCLISGGPGTGKTSTVIRIAALLAMLYAGRPFRIALAAPTGKAAIRLEESIAALLPGLPCSPEAAAMIPTTASTVHALLQPIPDSPYFRHDANHPLPCDAIIVDEASMIDLALMTKLFEAVPVDSRVILIGDRDQLASVEAGALLADLCGGDSSGYGEEMAASIRSIMPEFPLPGGKVTTHLADCIVTLRTNYRFGSGSGIGQASRAINAGDFDTVKSILTNEAFPDCAWWIPQSYADLLARLEPLVLDRWGPCFAAVDPLEALSRFAGFRTLCAVRNGPFGVEGINARVEMTLAREGCIPASGSYYRGKPIMVTRNDYQSNLFNGDVGIIFPDPEDEGVLKAFFPNGGAHVKAISLVRLPPNETAYAMTVHKAQGSEFKETILILPPNPSPLLTRELLYTGVTRARERCEIWCGEEMLRHAVETRLKRTSGLGEKLWGKQ